MKTIHFSPRAVFWTFNRKKMLRIIAGILLFQLFFFGVLYYRLRDPVQWLQQYLPSTERQPGYLFSIYGPVDNAMKKPMAVTVSGRHVYIADTGNCRVMAYDYNGNFLYSFGAQGTKPGEFLFPYGLAADSEGRILVADMYSGHISVFSPQGSFLHYFATPADITSPAGIAVNEGRVYVSDVGRHQVIVFDETGQKIFEFGAKGSEPGQFLSPNAVAVSGVYIAVSDTGNHRLQIFNKLGTLVAVIPEIEPGYAFVNPRGLAYNSRGEVYAVNNLTHQVACLLPQGTVQFLFGQMGHEEGQFFLPNGIYIDDAGRIYITDTSNQRVSVFQQ
jgi:DNA-binding beta-propeller fold protein YncE